METLLPGISAERLATSRLKPERFLAELSDQLSVPGPGGRDVAVRRPAHWAA